MKTDPLKFTSTPSAKPLGPEGIWRRKRMLVLGNTYPSYSRKYTELVCTGVIDVETNAMLRIHPVPKRYLESEQAHKNWQFIDAEVRPNLEDARPESWRIKFESILPGLEIPASDHASRRAFLDKSPHLARSVEELEERNHTDGTSLGIVRPKSISVRLRKRTEAERREWLEGEQAILWQETMLVDRPKRIDFPEAEFVVTWTCDDPRCRGEHSSGLKAWAAHEGYRKMAHDPDRDGKFRATLEREFDLTKRDVYLFLGTFHNHRRTFGLMDAYRPPRVAQLGLAGIV